MIIGVDRPTADVLRRADVGTGLVYGAKRGQRAQIDGVQRENDHLHHPSAVVRSVLNVRQDTVAGQRPDSFSGHAQRSHRILQNVMANTNTKKIDLLFNTFYNFVGKDRQKEMYDRIYVLYA